MCIFGLFIRMNPPVTQIFIALDKTVYVNILKVFVSDNV